MDQPTNEPQVIQTRRTLPYAPAEIHAAFADPARLATWWGPKDFTNSFETFEFKAGGNWKFVMHAPDGSHYRNESVFAAIEPGRIVIRHVSQPHFTLTVSLAPVAAGTQVSWVQMFEDARVAVAIRPIAEPANEQNLDRLEMQLRGEL